MFGVFVLYASIYSFNRSLTNQTTDRMMEQEWYWGSDVLPDHPFYSVLMMRDKISLWMTPQAEQPQKRISYANVRFNTAMQLAQKGNIPLAVSTLSKSQQYILDAAVQARDHKFSHTSAKVVYQQLDESLYKLSLFLEKHPEANTPLMQSLASASKSELLLLQDLASGSSSDPLL